MKRRDGSEIDKILSEKIEHIERMVQSIVDQNKYDNKSEDVDRCPFCGSNNVANRYGADINTGLFSNEYVMCKCCGARGPILNIRNTEYGIDGHRKAVKLWNQRSLYDDR